jgi:transposase
MREGISIEVSAADRERLAAVAADRNSRQKHVWRARIILATAEGCGTAEIMRRAGVSKPCVWRWQERFMREGVAGLLRDKTRKPGLPPLPSALIEQVVELTLAEPPGEATHWTGREMAAASGISLRSVQRMVCSRTGCDASSCRRTRRLPPNCATWSGSISTRRRIAGCCRLTESRKSRLSTAPSRGCH